MRKILIISMSLTIGGTEKSLVNLLNMIDYTVYDVDLILFQKKGPFLKQIPKFVHLVEQRTITILFQSITDTLKMDNLSICDIILSLKRYVITLYEHIKWTQFDHIRIHRWIDYFSKYISNNENRYDVAIAYAGGETAYYMVDKVQSNRKVYYFHSDYSKIAIDKKYEAQYVDKVDMIITISDVCKASLDTLFPSAVQKIQVLRNLSSPKLIKDMAKEFYPIEYKEKRDKTVLLSVGRLNYIKGYDMAVETAKILRDKGIDFMWVIIGEGSERKKLEELIRKYNLQEWFYLIGVRENPYPYMLHADIIIQTSRFEGKSIVLDEAKILNKIIIATNYNSISDQIEDGKNGIIVEMSAISIAEIVIKCVHNPAQSRGMIQSIHIDENIEDIENYMGVLMGSEYTYGE